MALKVAGYAKLANYWKKHQSDAIEYHKNYFIERFKNSYDYQLIGVFIDITGCKSILKRPEMLSLLRLCKKSAVDVIFLQTKAYLAADTREFCYLVKYLFELEHSVDLITDDVFYKIDTLTNADNQKEALYKMASEFCSFEVDKYNKWKAKILKERSSEQ